MATYVTIAKRPVIVFTIRAGRSSARDIMSLYRMSKSPMGVQDPCNIMSAQLPVTKL